MNKDISMQSKLREILELCVEKSSAECRRYYSFQYNPFFENVNVKKYYSGKLVHEVNADADYVLRYMQDE